MNLKDFTDENLETTMEESEMDGTPQDASEKEEGQEQEPTQDVEPRIQEFESKYAQLVRTLEEQQSQQQQKERALQAQSDKRIQELRQQFEAEREQLENQLNDLTLRTLDEEEREKYQRQMLQKQKERADQKMREAEQKMAEFQEAQAAIQAFSQMGITPDKLDLSSRQAIVDSGWRQVQQELAELRAQKESAPVTQEQTETTPDTKPTKKPQPKRTLGEAGARGSAPAKPTISQVIKSVGEKMGDPDMPEEVFWRLIETGQINPSILPDER